MRYVIFGAGENAPILISYLEKDGAEIWGLVDNNPKKWETSIGQYKVYSPEEIPSAPNGEQKILISVSNRNISNEIARQLTASGFVQGQDFEDGAALYSFGDVPGRVSGEIELPEGFSPHKTYDSTSRLVQMQASNRLFRMVFSPYEKRYERILQSLEEQGLLGKEVVGTKKMVNKWDLPCCLLLEHQVLAPITYSFEWTPRVFRAYVQFMLELIRKLTKGALSLCDGHHLNATIHRGRFVFFDFGAIGEGITPPQTMLEFLNMHVIPLILMQKHQLEKAYACLKQVGIIYTLADVQGYLTQAETETYKEMLSLASKIERQEDVLEVADRCEAYLQSLGNMENLTIWDGYQDDEWSKAADRTRWSEKMKGVAAWLDRLKPKTIIDIAGNMGWYGSYLHDSADYAIIMDMDVSALDTVWERTKTEGYANVLPAYMSFCSPTLANYRDSYIDTSLGVHPWLPAASSRLRSELALALAIVHHLAFLWQLTFEEIVGQLRAFTTRYLIVEFIEKTDRYITDFKTEAFGWYTKENFEKELSRRFDILETSPSTPNDTRTLYLCKVRSETLP